MNTKAVLVILAVLVPLLQASEEVTDGKSGNGPVNININLPGFNLGGGGMPATNQEVLLAELQGQMRDMEMKLITIPNLQKQNADLTDKLTNLQEELSNVTTELWLHKKACCNKTLVCPSGYEKFLDKCFKVSTDEKNYTDARSACQAAGGHLPTPKDKATNDFLFKHVTAQNAIAIWLGLTDLVTEGTWMWEDGSPLAGWSNWGSHQPDNSAPDIDCTGLLMAFGEWYSAHCGHQVNYMCEVSATVSP